MKKYLLLFFTIALGFFCISMALSSVQTEETAAQGIVKRGAVGGPVWEIQGRLQHLGFYKGKVDGKFGWQTYWSVRNFQHRFGMKVDGTVGPKTRQKLWQATKNWKPGTSGTARAQSNPGGKITKRGAVGGEVWEIQGRLQHLGFYKGNITGKYGPATENAVRTFQRRFGMKVTGAVGPDTRSRLWRASQNWPGNRGGGGAAAQRPAAPAPAPARNPAPARQQPAAAAPTYKAHGYSDNDLRMMANAVYGEARGEPYVGQVAVAAVILNRVRSATFPNNPTGVIFEPRAFTAVADGQIWLSPNDTARKAVQDALNGWDPSGGAMYYFNPDTATSGWIWTRPQIKKIGKHIFCN
ncbi:spore cortex-lytic enzyme [Ammoniphilus sp. YIM 78166]|uniref:spore cortex-lytic enzyme n=1 Tax=Ammoniphilus sp. YIM 78166 TaxID=1644106 RepID=UPI001F0D95C2|nr:spore cortex-lytic enzyme [Ammoniphilus sp. YIM 78166]